LDADEIINDVCDCVVIATAIYSCSGIVKALRAGGMFLLKADGY
jgi:hypothetical protein